jgi:hypothetical protein
MEICYDKLPADKALFSFVPGSELSSVLVLPGLHQITHQVNELTWWKAVLFLGWLDFQAKRLGVGDFQVLLKA